MNDDGSLECLENQSSADSMKDEQLLIKDLLARLDELTGMLEATNRGLEPRFVQVGNDLQSVYAKTSELEKGTAEAAGMMGRESEQSALIYAEKTARDSLAMLRNCQGVVTGKLDNVGSIAKHLGELHPHSQTLNKIARQLRVIGVYFAVEGSRTSDLSGAFTAFTQELRRLADKVSGIADDISTDSRKARTRQTSAHINISDDSKQLRKLTVLAEAAVNDAVRDIERVISFSVSALERIAVHSHNISRYVGSVVVALQFHDITRQQVEHVVDALRDVSALCQQVSKAPAGDDQDYMQFLGQAYAILSVQAAQMSRVVVSIREAHQAIESAFHQIGSESAQVAVSVAGLSSDCVIDAAGDPFAGLKSEFGNLRRLMEQGQALSERTCETATYASEAANLLAGHVKHVSEINAELKIKALNAIVKSTGLGNEGQAISVLAQEVMKLSEGCNSFVEQIVRTLESILCLSADLSKRLEDGQDSGSDITGQIESGIALISKRYDEFLGCSSRAMGGAESLQVEVAQARDGLDFLNELADELSHYLNGIEGMVSMLVPWSSYAAGQVSSIMEEQAARYTMESERDIQMQALASADGGASVELFDIDHSDPPAADSSSCDGGDDLGDNVELF